MYNYIYGSTLLDETHTIVPKSFCSIFISNVFFFNKKEIFAEKIVFYCDDFGSLNQ